MKFDTVDKLLFGVKGYEIINRVSYDNAIN